MTQFTSSEIEIQADQNSQTSSSGVLHGRQGTPAGKLPPIKSVVSTLLETSEEIPLSASQKRQRKKVFYPKGVVKKYGGGGRGAEHLEMWLIKNR